MGFLLRIVATVLVLAVPAAAEDLSEKYKDVQSKIREQQKKLRRAKELESSFLGQLEAINRQLDENRGALEEQRRKIGRTRAEIEAVKDDIDHYDALLGRQRRYLKRKLSTMQRYGNLMTSVVAAVVSSEDFTHMMRNVRYLRKIAEYDYRQVVRYRENLRVLGEKKRELGDLYTRLKDEESDLSRRQEELSADRNHKKTLLVSIRKQRDGYQRLLNELNEASNRLKQMLEERETDAYTVTRFSRLKGRLPWPVEGSVALPYGSYRDPQFNTPVFRRGIYIKAEEGVVTKSVYEGRVVYADWFKGYGKVIIISHGSGYHSVYANLDDIFIKPGEVVRRKTPIGRVGESGTISAPALYFEIRYKGKPLNPLQWLARRR